MCPARYRRHHGHRYVHTAARTCTSFPSSAASLPSPASSWSLSVASLRAHSHRFNLPKSVERTSHTHRLYTQLSVDGPQFRAQPFTRNLQVTRPNPYTVCAGQSARTDVVSHFHGFYFLSVLKHIHTRQIMDNYCACGVCVSGLE